MNIKKAVLDRIISLLENERYSVEHKLWRNKAAFRKLTEEQTILKRERVKLTELIRGLNPPTKPKED